MVMRILPRGQWFRERTESWTETGPNQDILPTCRQSAATGRWASQSAEHFDLHEPAINLHVGNGSTHARQHLHVIGARHDDIWQGRDPSCMWNRLSQIARLGPGLNTRE